MLVQSKYKINFFKFLSYVKNSKHIIRLSSWNSCRSRFGDSFCPRQRKNTRKKIKDSITDKVDELKEQVESLTKNLRKKTSDLKESLEEKVDNLLAESKDKSEDIISLLEKKIASMKKEAKK